MTLLDGNDKITCMHAAIYLVNMRHFVWFPRDLQYCIVALSSKQDSAPLQRFRDTL